MTYDKWISEHAARIAEGMRQAVANGQYDLSIYATPALYPAWGTLTLASQCPEGATDIVRLGTYGSNVLSVPYSALQSLLWHACRRLPICGEA